MFSIRKNVSRWFSGLKAHTHTHHWLSKYSRKERIFCWWSQWYAHESIKQILKLSCLTLYVRRINNDWLSRLNNTASYLCNKNCMSVCKTITISIRFVLQCCMQRFMQVCAMLNCWNRERLLYNANVNDSMIRLTYTSTKWRLVLRIHLPLPVEAWRMLTSPVEGMDNISIAQKTFQDRRGDFSVIKTLA